MATVVVVAAASVATARTTSRGRHDQPSPRSSRAPSLQLHRRLSFVGTATVRWESATAKPRKCPPRLRRVSKRPEELLPRSAHRRHHPRTLCRAKDAGVVFLRPASPGTGVTLAVAVRAVLEAAGVHRRLSKSLGSSNAINIVHATVAALQLLESPEAVARRRGLAVEDVAPAALLKAKQRLPKRQRSRPLTRQSRLKLVPDGRHQDHPDSIRDRWHQGPARHSEVARDEAHWSFRRERRSPRDRRDGQGHRTPRDGRGGITVAPLKLHHLRPAPGATTAKTRVVEARPPRAMTAVAEPRAPARNTVSAALRAARSRFTCAFRS